MKNHVTTDLAYFLAGIVAGGAAALLMAPASGMETRGQLRERIDTAANTVRNKKAEVMDHIDGVKQAGKDRLNSEIRRWDAALEAGKEAYHGEVQA